MQKITCMKNKKSPKKTKRTAKNKACRLCIKYGKEPNEETKRTIEEAENGEGLHTATSVEDLFRQLSE